MSRQAPPQPHIDVTFLRAQADRVSAAIQSHAFKVLSPAQEKSEPEYILTEAAKLVGVSHATMIRRATENSEYPKGRTEGNRRLYTLSEIHRCQEIEGTRPSRGLNPPVVSTTTNFKGGVTKSTTSVNNAQHLAEKGYRVLLVDLDPQASTTSLFGLFADRDVPEEHTVGPLFCGDQSSLEYAIRKTYWSGLDLIPSNGWVAVAETILPSRQNQLGAKGFRFFDVLKQGLEGVKNNYDVIILDTPPSLGFITMNALWAADGLIIPCPASMLDVQSSALFSEQMAATIELMNHNAGVNKAYFFEKFLITKYVGASAEDLPSDLADDDEKKRKRVTEMTAMAYWLRQLYGNDCVMHNVMPATNAVTSGTAIFRNLYELRASEHKINRQTLKRAMDAARAVGDEVEEIIRSCWAF